MQLSETTREVFVDHSNISIPALKQNRATRVNLARVTSLMESGGTGNANVRVGMRVVGGSLTLAGRHLWKKYEELGYKLRVHWRNRETGKEDCVDTVLHSAIQSCILTCIQERTAGNTTLVIGTGDGNDNGGLESFPRLVIAAVRAGINVEIWSWREALSQRYRALARQYPNKVSVHLLDSHSGVLYTTAVPPRGTTAGGYDSNGSGHTSEEDSGSECGSGRITITRGGFKQHFERFLRAHGGEVATNKLIVHWPAAHKGQLWQPEQLFGARLKALVDAHKDHFEICGEGNDRIVRLLQREISSPNPSREPNGYTRCTFINRLRASIYRALTFWKR